MKQIFCLKNYYEKFPNKKNGAGTQKIYGGVSSEKWWEMVSG